MNLNKIGKKNKHNLFLIVLVFCINIIIPDCLAEVINIPSNQIIGHTDGVPSISFSPDGKTLLSASFDGTVKLWDAHSLILLRTFHNEPNNWAFSVAFSPDGSKVLAYCGINCRYVNDEPYCTSGMAKIWDKNTGDLLYTFSSFAQNVPFRGDFSPDGKYIITRGENYSINLWDIITGNLVRTFCCTPDIISVSFSSDSMNFSTITGWFDDMYLWYIGDNAPRYQFREPIAANHFLLSSQYTLVITDEGWKIIDLYTYNVRNSGEFDIDGLSGCSIYSSAFSVTQGILLIGTECGFVYMIDMATVDLVHTFNCEQLVSSISMSTDKDLLATSSWFSNTINLWDISVEEDTLVSDWKLY